MNNQVLSQDSLAFSGDLSLLDIKTEYRSLKEDPVNDFYKPCLLNESVGLG